MHELRIMGRDGDNKWAWNPDVKEEVVEAKRYFDSLLLNGFFAFVVDEGEAIMVRDFPETAERIVLVPQISGG